MPDSYNSAKVKCPFYCKDKPQYIICSGVCDGTRINLWFNSNKKRDEYMEKHCFKINSKCGIAKMLWELNTQRKK